MSSELLRAGATLGEYPEREERREDWLERFVRRCTEAVRHREDASRKAAHEFAARVNQCGDTLHAFTDTAMQEHVQQLRQRMSHKGLDDAAVAFAFATVRELAQRTLGMRHFDEQLLGGWVMINGMLAEMETGEGKTLTATLPAATAALAGIPVHVITVNDYLARRDAEQMGPLYRALGLTTGVIIEESDFEQRRAAYACDITYCTNKQVAFDYLRDRITLGNSGGRLQRQVEPLHHSAPRAARLLLRGLCFAVVDEADSVLVDEARTPLIISRSGDTGTQELVYAQALELAQALHVEQDFRIDVQERRITLTDCGREQLTVLAAPLQGIWTGPRRREELVMQALSALHLFLRDRHYLVKDGKVQIIDENTGRIMADRSWELGQHQMIERKEGCELTPPRETLARISYQRFFRRYLRLAGMTGTAREVSGELRAVYGLNSVTIPTRKPSQRQALPDRLFVDAERKWNAAARRIETLHAQGRPILVGTRTVLDSEHLSRKLNYLSLKHKVLNARQDQDEAEIVARAGTPGRITVATNMAGRGTDIPLAPGVADNGGLHVIATQRNDAQRIDRQLFGRCARQGDPGSHEVIAALTDELLVENLPAWFLAAVARYADADGALPRRLTRFVFRLAQGLVERRHRQVRAMLLHQDEQLADLLAFTGRME